MEHTIFRWFCCMKRKCLFEVEAACLGRGPSKNLISGSCYKRPNSRQAKISNKHTISPKFNKQNSVCYHFLRITYIKPKPTGGIGPGCKQRSALLPAPSTSELLKSLSFVRLLLCTTMLLYENACSEQLVIMSALKKDWKFERDHMPTRNSLFAVMRSLQCFD